jgi:hypothetical protein
MTDLKAVPVIGYTGIDIRTQKRIPPLRSGYYYVSEDETVIGDAPKHFIRVYEYGNGKKNNHRSWPAFIAKVGHKWYPGESITEHLLTRVGQCFGMNVADSQLMQADGQIRFLSRYFLKRGEVLVHGAQVISGYLEEDEAFIENVEREKLTREWFTVQFIHEAIRSLFPDDHEQVFRELIRLFAFDAIVGNNDRHHYNWGVIVDPRGQVKPRLAPIYDTARALFWNDPEAKLRSIDMSQKQVFLNRYIRKSKPKTGWEGIILQNHFHLVKLIFEEYPEYRSLLESLHQPEALERLKWILNHEFRGLITGTRCKLMLDCLNLRLKEYNKCLC